MSSNKTVTRAERIVAALLAATIAASIAFAVSFALWAQTQLCAALLAVALVTLAAAMVVYEHEVMPRREAVEDRGSLPSGTEKADAAADTLLAGLNETIGSRRGMLGLFASALAALGVALVFPLRSLLPSGVKPADVAGTNWRRGARLVREDGRLVRASDVEVNSVLTVFPEGFTGHEKSDAMANDATVVVRVPLDELHLPADRATWAPEGLIAFSKVCTHAGCPVALYRAAARQLFCPCHQSTFDVLAGGARIFGPAARGLPQLPLQIAADGTLVAADGFPEPIGPGYWERS